MYKHSIESLDETFWTQATWFVDPQNVTGLANDNNTGIDAAHPVISYTRGIAAKWGTVSPTLKQDTTITWLSSQLTTDDPIILRPVMAAPAGSLIQRPGQPGPGPIGAKLYLVGVLGVAQLVSAGVLAGVVPKNRVTGQLLTVTTPAQVGPVNDILLIENTTPGKESFSWTTRFNAFDNFTPGSISQPLAPLPLPVDPNSTFTAVDTWSNGDTFNLWKPIEINLVQVEPVIACYDVSTDFAAQVQVQHLTLISADGGGDSSVFMGSDVSFVECYFEAFVVDNSRNDVLMTGFFNCACGGGGVSANAGNIFSVYFAGWTSFFGVSAYQMDFDVMFACGNATIFRCPFSDPNVTAVRLGTAYISGKAVFNGTWDFSTGTLAGGQPIIWGPGNLECQGAGTRIYYRAGAGEAVATFRQTGGFHLDDQANANAFNPATGLFSSPIIISAPNLDLAFALGGFGGLAVNMGGASISNQGTP